MMEAAQSDWMLQALLLLATFSFAIFMRFVLKSDKEIAILLMQGLLAISSIVVVMTVFNSRMFTLVVNQHFVMVIPAMMTLIYLGRDVFNSFHARHHDDK